MKIISPQLHAILDYLTVVFLVAAPSLFNFSATAVTFTYCLAGVHLLLTLLTRFTGFSSYKIIPFPLHGLIEVVVAVVLIILGFTLFKESKTDHFFYVALGIVILLVFTLTDFKGKASATS